MDFLTQFPVTPDEVLSVISIGAVTYVVTALLKVYLSDYRYTNLLAWGIALVISFAAAFGVAGWDIYRVDIFRAFMTALWGVAIATFGHELFSNMLGLFGVGPRE